MAEEKNFENRVKKWFQSIGIYPSGLKTHGSQKGWYIKIWGGGYQKSGIPDMLICVKGVFIGCELKAPNGTPSNLQIYNMRQIDQAGGYAVLLYPEQFELFKNFILCILAGDMINAGYNYDTLKSKWKHFENKIKEEMKDL